jgi:hypothetical protein
LDWLRIGAQRQLRMPRSQVEFHFCNQRDGGGGSRVLASPGVKSKLETS